MRYLLVFVGCVTATCVSSFPQYDDYGYEPYHYDPYYEAPHEEPSYYPDRYREDRYDRDRYRYESDPNYDRYQADRYREEYRRPERYPDRLRQVDEENRGFDSADAMRQTRKMADSSRAIADFMDSMTSSRGANDLIGALGDGSGNMGKTIGDLSSIIRGTANLMEKGAGTLVKISNNFSK